MKYLNWRTGLIALALAGCADGAAKSGEVASVSLALQVAPTGDAAVGREAQGGAFTIEHATAVVERFELYVPRDSQCEDALHDDDRMDCDASSDDDGAKLTVRGPFVVNLIDGTATPSLENVLVPAGVYRRIDVRFSDDSDAEHLDGLALVADGQFAPSADAAIPFELRLEFNEDARFESEAGIELGAGGASEVLMKLDVGRWFADLPVGKCMSDGDLAAEGGTLTIDERSDCSHIERDLRAAIRNSGSLE